MDAFVDIIKYAVTKFEHTILLEPISQKSVPGYFLNTLTQANEVIEKVANDKVKIMFDCFHIQHEEDDVLGPYLKYKDMIGHIQIASFPDRNEPDSGIINYQTLIPTIIENGYTGRFGCEYNPKTTMENGLSWMEYYRK